MYIYLLSQELFICVYIWSQISSLYLVYVYNIHKQAVVYITGKLDLIIHTIVMACFCV